MLSDGDRVPLSNARISFLCLNETNVQRKNFCHFVNGALDCVVQKLGARETMKTAKFIFLIALLHAHNADITGY